MIQTTDFLDGPATQTSGFTFLWLFWQPTEIKRISASCAVGWLELLLAALIHNDFRLRTTIEMESGQVSVDPLPGLFRSSIFMLIDWRYFFLLILQYIYCPGSLS